MNHRPYPNNKKSTTGLTDFGLFYVLSKLSVVEQRTALDRSAAAGASAGAPLSLLGRAMRYAAFISELWSDGPSKMPLPLMVEQLKELMDLPSENPSAPNQQTKTEISNLVEDLNSTDLPEDEIVKKIERLKSIWKENYFKKLSNEEKRILRLPIEEELAKTKEKKRQEPSASSSGSGTVR